MLKMNTVSEIFSTPVWKYYERQSLN